MNETTILHVMILDKFLPSFIDFIDEHFGRENHHYVFITSEKYEYGLTKEHNVEFLHTDDDIFITLLECMIQAKKIILHGLWRDKIDLLLYSNQTLLKKCYWVMWGGDFYFPETKSVMRKEVIKKMGHCIPVNYGDYLYIKEHYTSSAIYHECLNYPRSILIQNKDFSVERNKDNVKKVLVGNSATQTNFHFEIFDKLRGTNNIEVYVPLSYGDKDYAKEVIAYGRKCFQYFYPLVHSMDSSSYQLFLETMDVAIFKHNRQQAVSTMMSLLGMGKTVYMSKIPTTWEMFAHLGMFIKDIDIFTALDEISTAEARFNISTINDTFSERKAAYAWGKVFSYGSD